MTIAKYQKYLAFCLCLLTACVAQAQTPDRRVPESAGDIKISYAPVVKKVTPAVVNIITKQKVREVAMSPLMADPFFRQFFGQNMMPGMTRERERSALGSGVIVGSKGLIVTNNHVIKGADKITVILSDRREFPANVVLRDEKTDLAVLQLEGGKESFPTLQLANSDGLQVGDLVLAVGNPFGVGQTVTSGIISALARTNVGISDYGSFIQTDAAINPGNSGGALVDMDGKLIGINTAIFSQTGGSVGIGFAIPSNMLRSVLATIDAGGKKVVRPWLGIEVDPVSADMRNKLRVPLADGSGLLLTDIHAQSPSGTLLDTDGKSMGQSKLQVGDIITKVDDVIIHDTAELQYRMVTMAVGQVANFAIIRDNKNYTLQIKLTAAPESATKPIVIKGDNPFAGAEMAELSPSLIDELNLSDDSKGVVVTKPPSAKSPLRLRAGDIILQINKRRIRNLDDMQKSVASNGNGWDIVILRGNQTIRGVFR